MRLLGLKPALMLSPYAALKRRSSTIVGGPRETGAGDGGRTRDIDLGKVALYH
jgi:hypothetical protein